MHHIIFDLDGTLIDSKNEIFKTYKTVFEEIRPAVLPDVEQINYGATLNDVLKTVYGVETEKIMQAKQLFSSLYDTSYFLDTHLYEGVTETLDELLNQGNKLYIATNKRYTPTIRILELKNMLPYFTLIYANEMQAGITLTKQQMLAAIKKNGSFTLGFMVGDTVSDIIAGKNENLLTIAVNYGYENKSILAAENPTFSIDDFVDLPKFVGF